jgi:hypothetical protein
MPYLYYASLSETFFIALAIKGIDFEIKPVHLLKDGGQQVCSSYVIQLYSHTLYAHNMIHNNLTY